MTIPATVAKTGTEETAGTAGTEETAGTAGTAGTVMAIMVMEMMMTAMTVLTPVRVAADHLVIQMIQTKMDYHQDNKVQVVLRDKTNALCI